MDFRVLQFNLLTPWPSTAGSSRKNYINITDFRLLNSQESLFDLRSVMQYDEDISNTEEGLPEEGNNLNDPLSFRSIIGEEEKIQINFVRLEVRAMQMLVNKGLITT